MTAPDTRASRSAPFESLEHVDGTQDPGDFLQRANTLAAALMRRRGAVLGLSLISLVAIALVDLSTGYELALSMLYVAPVVAATWAFGIRAGLALSVLATAAWVVTDAFAEHHYSLAIYRFWEGFIRLATFSLFALMVDQLKRALARSDERLIKVLEGLDTAVCVLDPPTGAILYSNQRYAAAFPAEAGRIAAQELLNTCATLRPGDTAAEEIQILERWYLVGGRWLSWADARPVLLLNATDVSARRMIEARNQEQEARLQTTARLVTVGEIASSIAHELNQPLAAVATYVRGALRRLRSGEVDTQALGGALEQAGEQAERAGQIIRRVRDFVHSREPVLTALDLNEVLGRAVAAAEREAERIGLRVVLQRTRGLPRARMDAVMIEQVVLNLVRNALEAMRGGATAGGQVQVFSAREDAETLRVTVADRGPGVAAEAQGRLFEPFYSTKPEGMGLGLNICRSIVEFHGGRLWMTPRPGGGAEFHFTLRTVVQEP